MGDPRGCGDDLMHRTAWMLVAGRSPRVRGRYFLSLLRFWFGPKGYGGDSLITGTDLFVFSCQGPAGCDGSRCR